MKMKKKELFQKCSSRNEVGQGLISNLQIENVKRNFSVGENGIAFNLALYSIPCLH
jgi:hypothetical protein